MTILLYIFTGQKELENDLTPVAAKWNLLGVQLRIDSDTLECIGGTSQLCEERLQKTMNEWLKNVDGPKTWKQIIEALESPPVERRDVARTLQGFVLCCLIITVYHLSLSLQRRLYSTCKTIISPPDLLITWGIVATPLFRPESQHAKLGIV